MRSWQTLLPLLALALGCLRSPLPADADTPATPSRPAARTPEPLEAVALGGPGLRGLEPARLPERSVLPAAPVRATEPLLAHGEPSRPVVDKSRARLTDPAPAAGMEDAPAEVARVQAEPERRPFLRPAVAEPADARPASPPPPASPAPEGRTPAGEPDSPAAEIEAASPPPPPPAPLPRARPRPEAEPEPEREILAAADGSPAPGPPARPAPAAEVQEEAPAPGSIPPRTEDESPMDMAVPSPLPREPELAQHRPAPVLRTAGGGSEPVPVADDGEETRPARPTASPDARFQVQIMSASDPEGADDMRLQAELVFPDEVVEVVWDPPYYKVRVGAEATQEGAVELKRRALRLGFQNAWVVPRRQP